MVIMTIIFFVTAMILVATLFYLVIYAFVMDLNLAKDTIINAIKLAMSRKNRNEFIKEYHRLLNTFLKNTATEIVQTKDKVLAGDLGIADIDEVKVFKKLLIKAITDKNYEFMSYEDVKDYLNEERVFSFMSQIYLNTRLYSNSQTMGKVNDKSLSALANLVFAEDIEGNRIDNFQKMYNAIA